MSTDPLAGLVEASCQGDQRAFARLVEATQSDVYNLALSVLKNQQDAEDATQETYLRVWRALQSFRGQAQFRTWLYRVSLNTSLNRRRALQRVAQNDVADQELDLLPGDIEGPAETTLRREGRRALWERVSALPERYRVVVTLFYQQQLSYQEISQVLALPLGTVKSYLNRARKALAKSLRPQSEASDAQV